MSTFRSNRREFLKTAGAAAAATTLPYWFTSDSAQAFAFQAATERPVVGCIGTGSRWEQIVKGAMQFGDVVAVCDVDEAHSGKARDLVKDEQGKKGRDAAIDVYGDYRKILERKDIDIVTIVTPDHWHSKIAIEAMKAGKDIYCEKPLTLTIDEGKQIIKVLNETKRVFQVGTQQRTEMNQRFLQAIALIQAGRIGKVKKVQCAIGAAPVSGPLKVEAVPAGLNWDMWLGQTPLVVRILRRQDDRLGRPPRGHRPVGHRHAEQRPDEH